MLTSVTLSPVRFSTRFITLRRTSSVVCGITVPYSMAIVRSKAASSSPTSAETPLVSLPPPLVELPPPTALVTLPKNPLTAAAVLPPICTFSTSCAATPAILLTAASPMVVRPRCWRGCWLCCCSLMSLFFLLLLLLLGFRVGGCVPTGTPRHSSVLGGRRSADGDRARDSLLLLGPLLGPLSGTS